VFSNKNQLQFKFPTVELFDVTVTR